MNKFLITTALLLTFGSAPAKAAVTATFCGPDSEGGTCEGPNEVKVFLEGGKAETLGLGNAGSQSGLPIIDFKSDGGSLNDLLDFSNGFATIKPKQGAVDFNGVDITVPGFTFTDLAFDVQLTPVAGAATDSFTVDAFTGAHVLVGAGSESDKADTDKQFSVTAQNGVFDEVDIRSLTGFDEIKHIEISGLQAVVGSTVPEPSTWALMALGFAGLGFVGFRRTRQTPRSLA